MNHFFSNLILSLAICCFVLSCDRENPVSQDNSSCTPPTDNCAPLPRDPFQISPQCAFYMKCQYQENSYEFPKVNTPGGLKNVTGFLIDHGELITMLNQLGATNTTDSIFVMLGINKNNIADVFFVAQSQSPSKPSTTTYSYYDFTSPCPTWCPENMQN